MAKRTVQILPRVLIGPVSNLETPAVVVDPADREWLVRLDPDHDYPTCVWNVQMQWSFDNGATWADWRRFNGNGILFDVEHNVYPAIGGVFPEGYQPTHLKGFVTLSEQITIGLKAIAA